MRCINQQSYTKHQWEFQVGCMLSKCNIYLFLEFNEVKWIITWRTLTRYNVLRVRHYGFTKNGFDLQSISDIEFKLQPGASNFHDLGIRVEYPMNHTHIWDNFFAYQQKRPQIVSLNRNLIESRNLNESGI